MSEHSPTGTPVTVWVLGFTDGKWHPDSKYDGGKVSTALMHAEKLDKESHFDAVKVVRMANDGSGAQKELWVSSRLQARANAQQANQLSSAVAQSAAKLAPKKAPPAS